MKGILVKPEIEEFEDSSSLFLAISREIVLNTIDVTDRKLVLLDSLTVEGDIFPTQKHFDDLAKRIKRRGVISILNFYMDNKLRTNFGSFIMRRRTGDHLNVTIGLFKPLKCIVGSYYETNTLIKVIKEADSFEADVEYELIYSGENIVEIQVFLNVRQVTCKGRDNDF